MAEKRDIKYVNRDFNDFRESLIEYARNYFPDTFNDFTAPSPGLMFIEMAAYIGDVLSFYQDTQIQETFLQHANNPGNIYDLAYMMGYRPKVTTASEVEIEISQTVLNDGNDQPDFNSAAVIPENLILTSNSTGNAAFLVDQKIDFTFSSSLDPTDITIEEISGNTPTRYTLKKKAKAFSGEIVTTTFTPNSSERFQTFTIDDNNIIGILDVYDTNDVSNTWLEVPFLGQETVFEDETNTGADKGEVPYLLKLTKTQRRFTTRFNSNGNLILQFGAGSVGVDDSSITPSPRNVGLGKDPITKRISYAYDPSNFLFTSTYGIIPNTQVTVRYLKGGGVESNVPANTITSATLPAGTVNGNNLSFTNPKPASGGKDGDTIEEVRQNAFRSFNEQSRAVTLQDYTIRSLSLPSKFGTVGKVFVTQDTRSNSNNIDSIIDNNPLALSLYVLGLDNEGKLKTASNNLKENLKKYLAEYKIITDSINFKDAFIVNIGIDYDVILRPNTAGRDVLLQCSNAIKDFFDLSKIEINKPINISDIFLILDKIPGVQTVQKVKIFNKTGGNYSNFSYDVKGATRNNVVYPSYDPCIFEVKFPDNDIKGRITTL